MNTHVTRDELLALALPEETKLRTIRRFALWCAEQTVAARIERGWQCPRDVWICLLRTRRCLDDRSPGALAKLNRARRKTDTSAAAVAVYAAYAAAVYAAAAVYTSAYATAAADYAAAAAADYAEQREALTQIVLEELALTAVQDWRPSESLPEDYYALRIA